MRSIVARAKVNLFLKVLGKRPDGFHEIESVFHSIDLHDVVRIEASDATSVSMSFDGVPALDIPEQHNVAYRAAERLFVRTGRAISVHISKSIPHGAGLAGGSVDAAAVLKGSGDLGSDELTEEELVSMAAEIGSDVPYCLTGGAALVTGRGEPVDPLPAPAPLWLVLGISHRPLSTADVYGAWRPAGEAPSSHRLTLALGSGDVPGIAAALHNDLEAAACDLRPDISRGKQAMLDAGALGAQMSGSGPTIFGVAEHEEHAEEIAAGVKKAFDRVEITRTCKGSLEISQEG